MKKQKTSLFDPEETNEDSKTPLAKRQTTSVVNVLFTNITVFGKTIARGLSLIALAYLAWRGATEFFVTARNVSEVIALVVVSALLYIFLVK